MMRYLLSPVFFKELKQIANRRAFPIVKALLFLVLFFGPMFIAGVDDAGNTQMFSMLAWANAFAIMILTPIVASGAIAGERESRTLPLLFMTQLTSWNMAQDKALSRILHLLYLCGLSMPAMFALVLLGGVSASQVAITCGYLICLAVCCGGICVVVSSSSRSFTSAVLVSFCLVFCFALVWPIMVDGRIRFHPFVGMVRATEGRSNIDELLNCALLSLGLYLMCVVLAALRVRRLRKEEVTRTRKRGVFAFLWGVVERMTMFVWRCSRDEVNGNAVAWKNTGLRDSHVRKTIFALMTLFLLLGGGYLVLIAGFGSYWRVGGCLYNLCAVSVILAILFSAIQGAAVIADERRNGTLDILLTTKVKASDYINGMLLGHFRTLVWICLIPMMLAGGICLTTYGEMYLVGIFVWPLTLLAGGTFMASMILGFAARFWRAMRYGSSSPLGYLFSHITPAGMAQWQILPAAIWILGVFGCVAYGRDDYWSYGQAGAFSFIMFIPVLIMALVFATLLGTRCSLRCKTMGGAISLTVGVLAAAWLLPIAVNVMMPQYFFFWSLWRHPVLYFSPAPVLFESLGQRNLQWRLAFLHLLFYGGLSTYLYVSLRTRFNRRLSRQPD